MKVFTTQLFNYYIFTFSGGEIILLFTDQTLVGKFHTWSLQPVRQEI